MYPRASVKKAKITNLDSEGQGPKSVEFPFNPSEITIKRGEGFTAGKSKGVSDWAGLQWEKAGIDSMDCTFILDETEEEPSLDNPLAGLHQMAPISPIAPNILPAKMAMFVPGVNGDSVKKIIDNLYNYTLLVKPKDKSGKLRRPSLIKFEWGDVLFAGGITNLEFKYTLFDSDGTAKRAEVTLQIQGRYCRSAGEADAEKLLSPDEAKKKVSVG